MKATSYYRVPAVIFAVLVGGLFVYAKSGGRFLTPGKPTPAADSVENDPSLPRIEFMMGPKSAPAFLPDEPTPGIQPTPVQAESQSVTSGRLLPGSKSAVLVSPESLVPAKEKPSPTDTPQAAPSSVQPTGPRLLPGSKSLILVDPSTLKPQQANHQPAPPTNVAPPANAPPANAERPRSLLPGSKSRAVVDPESLVPQRQPVPNQVYFPPVQKARPQPAPQQGRNIAPRGVER